MRKSALMILSALILSAIYTPNEGAKDVLELIGSEADLKQFHALIEGSESAKRMLRHDDVTVFAPTDHAFRKYREKAGGGGTSGAEGKWLLSYHLVKTAVTSGRFPAPLSTELPGGLPVWVCKRGTSGFVWYVNNAEIVRGDIKGESKTGSEQVLHVIDEVLEPTLPVGDDPNLRNPTAYRMLTNPSAYGLLPAASGFAWQVRKHRKEVAFQGGSRTFFVPVDGSASPEVWSRVDEHVIDVHVLTDRVHFLRTFPPEGLEALAFGGHVTVVVTLRNATTGSEGAEVRWVESDTTRTTWNGHPGGKVKVRVVKANLPVQNGVVHLIESPLLLPVLTVREVLERNGDLGKFHQLLRNYNPELLSHVERSEVSVFAPNDRAFNDLDPSELERAMRDRKWMVRMLELHVSPRKFTTQTAVRGASVLPTMDPTRPLHFRLDSRGLSVQGGGVSANVLTPDVEAINGVVHVIDRVLGLPVQYANYDPLPPHPGQRLPLPFGPQQYQHERFRLDGLRDEYFRSGKPKDERFRLDEPRYDHFRWEGPRDQRFRLEEPRQSLAQRKGRALPVPFGPQQYHNERFRLEEPKNERFRLEESKNERFRLEEPRNEHFRLKEPKDERFRLEKLKNNLFRLDEPKNEHFRWEGPRNERFRSEESRNDHFRLDEPRNERFLSVESKTERFRLEELKNDLFRLDEPKNEQFRLKEPKDEQFRLKEPKDERFRLEELKNDLFRLDEPKNEHFRWERPRNERFRSEESRNDHFRLDEPKNEHFRWERPRNERFRSEESRNDHFRLDEPRNEHFRLKEPRNEQFRLKEPKDERFRLEGSRDERFRWEEPRQPQAQRSGRALPVLSAAIDSVREKIDFFESNGSAYVRWEGRTEEVVEAEVENGTVRLISHVFIKPNRTGPEVVAGSFFTNRTRWF